jgi:osmoprotectant transport system permease protein
VSDALTGVWETLASQAPFFSELLWEHLQISATAILIALVVGGVVGILISEFQRAARPTLGVINFLYTIPSISMLGFLIPFSGVGDATAVIALTVYALLPMAKSMHTGLANVDPAILEAARGMGGTRMQVLARIKLPLAAPVVMSGVRSMVTMTIALAGIASFIGAGGLGVAIYRGITTNNAAMTMAGSLLIALLALVADFLLGLVERGVVRHRRRTRGGLVAAVASCVVALAFAGYGLLAPATGKDTIRIATKPMTEQYILGDMLKLLIEQDTGLKVEMTQGVGGGTSNIEPAMEKGDYDLYPEYTGTGWNLVLGNDGTYSEGQFDTLRQEYADRLNMRWVGMYGFNDTYGIAVRSDVAERYGLRSYSDLAAVSGRLTFGAEYDFFERKDGYQALCDAYGLGFATTMDLDIGLKYQALSEGRIDAAVVFTTDGQLVSPGVTVLEDNRHFFPSYRCGTVVRQEALDAHPELVAVLERLDGAITDEDMARMNHEVESDGKDPETVAEEFLRGRGLLSSGGGQP